MDALSDLVLEEQMRSLDNRILPNASTDPQIIVGFGLSDYTLTVSSTAKLSFGVAIVRLQKDGDLYYGFLLGLQDPTSYTLDFSGASNDTYSVYIRAVHADGDQENRVFWNAGSSDEYVDYTTTRRRVTWEASYVSSSAAAPGSEWVKVWDVSVTGGVIQTVTDRREFYYEGRKDDSYSHRWGDGTNDRNDSRDLYGVTDRYTWDQAIRRQLADIIGEGGPTQWWAEAPIDLTDLETEHYSGGAYPGGHKQVNVGATDRWWQLETLSTSGDSLRIKSLSHAEEPLMSLTFLDESASVIDSVLSFMVRGSTTDLSAEDRMEIRVGKGNDVGILLQKHATLSNAWYVGFGASTSPESPDVRCNVGSGITDRGVEILNGNYYVIDTATSMVVPWSALTRDVDESVTEWAMISDAAGDVASTAMIISQVAGKADDPFYIQVHNFPDAMILSSIDVMWTEGSGTVSSRHMRMYAAKHTMSQLTVGSVTGDGTTKTSLHSTTDYIEFSSGNQPGTEVLRFTCNASAAARTFARGTDFLALGFYSTDTTIQCSVRWIRLNFTYKQANPWPM
jgi:hypothetical protein